MPNPLQRAWQFLSQPLVPPVERVLEVKQAPLPWYPPGWAGSTHDLLALGSSTTADFNSAVFACLSALSLAHIEPPLKVFRGDVEGQAQWLADSPLQLLLNTPNPAHTNLELHWWTEWAKHLDGNAYWRKVRSGDGVNGNIVQLWPVSPVLMRPKTDRSSSNFIDYYEYNPPGRPSEKVPIDNVVHFRLGVDDQDMRLGLAPIKRLIREVASDEQATRFTNALLRNFGIPGLVVMPPLGANLSEEQAEALKAKIAAAFGSENRGQVGVLTGGATMQQFGFSPEQLNMKALHDVPETRICAVMGVPPAVAGLGVGLEQTSNFASMKQVRENFTEVSVVPTWRMDAAKLNQQLKPDFTSEGDVFIAYDLTKVRALQEDRNDLFLRLDNAVKTGWLTPNEARADAGYPPMAGGDVPMPQPMPATIPPPPPKPAAKSFELKAGEITPETLQALVELSVPGLTQDLEHYYDGVRRRTKRALLEGTS
jgi:HK97 family phage portal protein